MHRRFLLALALLVSGPADALILASGDGQGNTSAPPDDPGWAHVGQVLAPTGVYLGNGWVVTAAHVAAGDTTFGLPLAPVTYPFVPGSTVQLVNPDTSLADLHVFRIDPSPSLPLLPIRSTTPSIGTDVTIISNGFPRGAATSWMGYDGYLWGATIGMRWGTNRVYDTGLAGGNWTIATDFTKPMMMGGTTDEAQGADFDSGGAVFIKNGGTWELAGVVFAIGSFVGQPASTALFGKVAQPIGNLTYALDLAVYRDQLITITRPECANEIDDDGDTFIDWPADPNCTSELDDTELPTPAVPALPFWGRMLLVGSVLLLGLRLLQRRGAPTTATV